MIGSVEKKAWSTELGSETQIQQLLILHNKVGEMLSDVESLDNEILVNLFTMADMEIAKLIQKTNEPHMS